MDAMAKLLYDTKRLMMIRYPRFGSEIAAANLAYKKDLKYHTAATDGKNIYFDPDYLANLSESDRLFLIAHELMHIKFAHAYRLEDKNGVKRDPDVWNEATDAIINANLQRDGFTIKEGYVNRPEALKYSAEEFYQLLLAEKQQQQQNQQNQQNGSGQGNDQNGNPDQQSGNQDNQSSNENNNENDNQHIGDDHSLWEEAFEKRKSEKESSDKSESASFDSEEQVSDDSLPQGFDEKDEFSQNREERIKKAKENLEKMKSDMLNGNSNSERTNLGAVGESAEEFDWRMLLRREIEKTETIWSQRRSIAENNYAYRLEENDIEDEAETEVMIDVSGSVDLDLVRSFLRMLKPILKESKLKVGCFNEKYWGMKEIKNVSDIDNFEIPSGARGHSAWTEDWDLAVRSFTKKREINKIVFTDGEPCPGTMPKDDLKGENILWLVYGNKNFRPCCGKIIQITERQLEKLTSCVYDDYELRGRSR